MIVEKEDFVAGAISTLIIVSLVAGASGWVMNIAAIWRLAHHPLTAEIFIRAVGVWPFWPIGCILGWLQ